MTLEPGKHNYMVEENSYMRINCTADCEPDCSISWNKVSGELEELKSYLEFANISRNDKGTYACVATNKETTVGANSSVYIDVACKRIY